jgi:hypothetical protein
VDHPCLKTDLLSGQYLEGRELAMNLQKYIINVLFCSLPFLGSCSSAEEEVVLLRLPLYESCKEVIYQFEEKQARFGSNFKFVTEEFSVPVSAHPGMVGMLKVIGSLSDKEVVEVTHALDLICMPVLNSGVIHPTERGLMRVWQIMQENVSKGKKEFYIVSDGEDLNVYFNEVDPAIRRQILE